jgi:uncharacterized RDD family membrane protein YckC
LDPTNVVGRRVAAFLLDSLFVAVVVAAAWFALTKSVDGPCVSGGIEIGGNCRGFEEGSSNRAVWLLIDVVTGLVVFWILPSLRGASPGKAILGITVVGPDGRAPGLGRGLVRYLMFIVDGFPWIIPYLTGFICMVTDGRHRRLGDRAAKTLVVTRAQALPAATASYAAGWYPDPHGHGAQRYWDGSGWTEHVQ